MTGTQSEMFQAPGEVVPIPPRTRVDTRPAMQSFLNRQRFYAKRKSIPLEGSAGSRGDQVYVKELESNLVEALTDEHRSQFLRANGGELRLKARALHSSSMACVNYWAYWATRGRLDVPCRALGLPAGGTSSQFELCLPIVDSRPPANLDFAYRIPGGPYNLVGVEHKLTEHVSSRSHLGLRPVYMNTAAIWEGLPNVRALGARLSPDDDSFSMAHPAQYVKHCLSLHIATRGTKRFWLHTTYFDHGHTEFEAEMQEIAGYFRRDGLRFTWTSYQVAIARICRDHWAGNEPWCEMMSERFL